MKSDTIVHFVYFETALDKDAFIQRWENFARSANSDNDVTLQASKQDEQFTYIAEHRCDSAGFQFKFTKAAKLSRVRQAEIKTMLLGGYTIIKEEKTDEAAKNESKVFVFLSYDDTDVNVYKQLQFHGKLNIYKAYYENCTYAYILEFFAHNKYIPELMSQIHQYKTSGINIYKKCSLKTA